MKSHYRLWLSAKIILGVLLLFGAALLVGFFYNVASNNNTKSKIDDNYSKLGMSTTFHLVSKEYSGTSFMEFLYGPPSNGGPVYGYVYKVTAKQTMEQLHAKLAGLLKQHGYRLVKPADSVPADSVNWIDASSTKLCTDFILNPADNQPQDDLNLNAIAGGIEAMVYPQPC